MLCGRTQLPTAASSLFQVEILSCFITFSPSLASCQCPASPEAPSEQMSSPLALRESQLTEFSLFLLVLALDGWIWRHDFYPWWCDFLEMGTENCSWQKNDTNFCLKTTLQKGDGVPKQHLGFPIDDGNVTCRESTKNSTVTLLTWAQLHRLHNPLAIHVGFWAFTRLQSNNNCKENIEWDFGGSCRGTEVCKP